MLTIIVLIFTNLGKREAWQLSAYSVFNPNFERLPVNIKRLNILCFEIKQLKFKSLRTI